MTWGLENARELCGNTCCGPGVDSVMWDADPRDILSLELNVMRPLGDLQMTLKFLLWVVGE